MTRQPPARVWLFDLDNTLYAADNGLFDQVSRQMTRFIERHLSLDTAAASRLRTDYFHRYGTTLAGLMANHDVSPEYFLDCVHDVDYTCLVPDPALRSSLAGLPGRRIVYSNGSLGHAHRVLERLGVGDLFEAVHDIRAADYVPKPDRTAFSCMMARFAIHPGPPARPRTTMFDDLADNLVTAAQAGMDTVLVATPPDPDDPRHQSLTACCDDLVSFLAALPASLAG